jgi:hypothetical protein
VLDLLAPLTADGQLDAETFPGVAEYCRAHLTQDGTLVWSSPLLRSDGRWMLRPGPTEEAPLWPFQAHAMRPGEYFTLSPSGETEQTFRIVNVAPPGAG